MTSLTPRICGEVYEVDASRVGGKVASRPEPSAGDPPHVIRLRVDGVRGKSAHGVGGLDRRVIRHCQLVGHSLQNVVAKAIEKQVEVFTSSG